ncbi:hypothetical protein Syun_009665 [Stephania yunnanensis]|uniref:Uncharacterized protein n=1 Tax=Stephania yunnanensis TaxID=152371 RepID=A0AAP0KEV8_9MAGN
MSEMPQIESEEDQLLVLVQPPTLLCTFGKPYKGVEVRERLQIFYTADTFVLDDPDTIDSFVLEVPDELLNLKEGMHVSLPNYVNAPFVVDISKVMEGWSAKFCSDRMPNSLPRNTHCAVGRIADRVFQPIKACHISEKSSSGPIRR